MGTLLHVTTRDAWAAAERDGGIAKPAGGFLHLCTETQLAFVLGRHFVGQTGLVLLRIDPSGLDVRWEASEPGMPPFPHLYAALPAAAVRAVDAAA